MSSRLLDLFCMIALLKNNDNVGNIIFAELFNSIGAAVKTWGGDGRGKGSFYTLTDHQSDLNQCPVVYLMATESK